jgi:hypothetical protein
MLKRALTLATISALAVAGAVIPTATASAATTSALTVRLVAPSGSAIGAKLDSTASINVEATNPDGVDDFNEYYAAAEDPTDYPDSTWLGALHGGTATFDVPQGDEADISTSGGPEYLATYNPRKIGGGPVGISVKTIHGAVVTGHVTDPAGVSMPGVIVTAFDHQGFRATAATTDAAGNYRIVGLFSDTYRIQFNTRSDAGSAVQSNYVWNYWKGATSWAKSTAFSLKQQGATTPYTTKTAVNDALLVGHTMTVSTAFKTPTDYAGATVLFFPIHHGQADLVTTKLNADGTSSIARLAPNTYNVEIFTPNNNWYWTGNGKHVTANREKAKLIGFDGTQNIRILFN